MNEEIETCYICRGTPVLHTSRIEDKHNTATYYSYKHSCTVDVPFVSFETIENLIRAHALEDWNIAMRKAKRKGENNE